jgi:hypothetical protein
MSLRPRIRGRRHLARLGALAGVASILLALLGPTTGVSQATDSDPWTAAHVSATPTTALGDGRHVSVNIKTSSSSFVIEEARAQVCRSGVTYQPSTAIVPADDFFVGGNNCPNVGISTSADGLVTDPFVNPSAGDPAGETFTMKVGTGIRTWTDSFTNKTVSIQCDQDHPCTLVVELRAVQIAAPGDPQQPASWRPFVFQLTYASSDPIAGCGGPAKGAISSGGSDSLSDAWVAWTSKACKVPGQVGALTTGSFNGEGTALQGYASGQLDLAYSEFGLNPATGMVPADADAKRPSVAVPVGIGAAVLGLGGSYFDSTGRRRPYDPAQLTTAEIAALIAGGPLGAINDHLSDIYIRNPELATPGMFTAQSHAVQLTAPSEAEGTSWLTTRYLATLDPSDWVVPTLPLYGDDAGKARGIDAQLALANPSYNNAITLFSGKPILEKSVDSLDSTGGGFWALTDLTTADALGLEPTQVQNADLQFVAPTPDSMRAAVAGMQAGPDGTLVADPNQTQGYPLTYVVYAVVPAQPLADTTNVCRTSSQALLTKWLDYVTSTGQADLPEGMVPLTPDLKAQAAAAIKKVGASKPAKPCTNASVAPTTPPPANTVTTPPPAAPTVAGAIAAEGRGVGSVGATTSEPATGSSRTSGKPTLVVAANPHIPGYGGERLPSALLSLLAIVGVIVLTAAAAVWSSGWRPRRWRPPSMPTSGQT